MINQWRDIEKYKREFKCPNCKADMRKATFVDKLSKREYMISGLCQNCQDSIFGKGSNNGED